MSSALLSADVVCHSYYGHHVKKKFVVIIVKNSYDGFFHPGLAEIFAPDGVTGSDIIS